ncbi:DNA-directed RNA polymerase sigma-70 factor [Streptomyces sp. NPDC030392]|uniref:DNA-directed RNA polymerase sigma-70 factor n=1 Tax=Streptomyces sp. NPDC030392 TaxID=3155468 RepID=UPI0033CFA9BD
MSQSTTTQSPPVPSQPESPPIQSQPKSQPSRPRSAESRSGRPETDQPPADRSVTGKSPDADRPQAEQSPAGKPEAGTSEAGKSETDQSPAGKPEAGTSEAGKSETDQSPAGKPETGTSPADKPETSQSPAVQPVPGGPGAASTRARTAVESYDALYAEAAPALVHQVFLLTGRRRHAFDSVEHAFQRAWEHWPEVSHDPDPVAWVRAQAYDYALAPWQRFRLRPGRAETPPADPAHRALLELPAPYRRTVLLCDGLGLGVDEAAAECAAGVPATVSRLHHARAQLAEALPGRADADEPCAWLGDLAAAVTTATLPLARSVRTGSERRVRALTRTVYGLTAVLLGAVVFSAVSAPAPAPAPAPHGPVSDDGAPRDEPAPPRR